MTKTYLNQIIKECLNAVVNGPFIPDWEFSTLFGLERDEVRLILNKWPHANVQDHLVSVVINNTINNLIGYPIDQPELWDNYISISRNQLLSFFVEWKKDVYGETDLS